MEDSYHIWVYRTDGTKFVGKFKNAKEARSWSKAVHARLGSVTTAGRKRGKRKRRPVSRSPFDFRF